MTQQTFCPKVLYVTKLHTKFEVYSFRSSIYSFSQLTPEDLTCKLTRSQRSHYAIWIACKKINASSFLAPYRIPLIFCPSLTHAAGRQLIYFFLSHRRRRRIHGRRARFYCTFQSLLYMYDVVVKKVHVRNLIS